MARGTPDWAPLATSPDAEIPTYRAINEVGMPAFGGNVSVLTIFNPTGSGYQAKLRRVYYEAHFNGFSDNKQAAIFQFWRCSSGGDGALYSPLKHDTNAPASQMQVRLAPAVSTPASVSLYLQSRVTVERRSVPNLERLSSVDVRLPVEVHPPASQEQPLTIRPGQGFTIIAPGMSAAYAAAGLLVWTEEVN